MATEVLELQVRVTGASQVNSGFNSMASSGARAERSISGVRSALGFLRGALVVFAASRLFTSFFEVIDTFQRMQNSLRLVTQDVNTAAAAFQLVYETALRTRSPLESVNLLFGRLTRIGGLYNLTYGQVNDITRAVAESFQIVGATADETNNAIVQLSQGLALGILRGQDLRSVVEFNPRLAQVFADSLSNLGLAVDKYGHHIRLAGSQLYAFVTSHKNILTGKIAIEALLDSVQQLDAEFLKATPTIGQLYQNIKTTFTYLVGIVSQSTGLLDGLNAAVAFIGDHLGGIVAVMLAIGAALTTWLVIDLITLQFAKLFQLKGILGFLLAPIVNIAKGFIAIGEAIYGVGLVAVQVGQVLYRSVIGVVGVVQTVLRGIVGYVSFTVGALRAIPGAIISGVSAAIGFVRGVFNIAYSAVLGFVNAAVTAVGAVYQTVVGAATTISGAFQQLVTLTGSVSGAVGQLAASAAAGLGSLAFSIIPALVNVFLTFIALLPIAVGLMIALTSAAGGLVAISGAVAGLSGTISGAAGQVASWHEIFNTLIRGVLTGFYVIRDNLPAIMGAVGQAWDNLVAIFTRGVAVIVNAFNHVVQTLGDVVRFALRAFYILRAVTEIQSNPIGAALDIARGIGEIEGETEKALNGLTDRMQRYTNEAEGIATRAEGAAAKSAGAWANLLRIISKTYGDAAGDYIQAWDLLAKGVSPEEIQKRTGVAVGALKTLASIRDTLVPKTADQSDLGTSTHHDTTNRINSEIEAILNFAKQVSPYADGQAKMAEAHKIFVKAEKDGVDVDAILQRAGLTKIELFRRLARETAGVGNAATDYAEKVRLLDQALQQHNITQAEQIEYARKARIEYLTTQRTIAAGIELATLKTQELLGNQAQIAADIVTSATAGRVALATYVIQVNALAEAQKQGALVGQEYANALRDAQITALNTQQDALSGFQRGLLTAQKSMNDFASTASETVTKAFDDLTDALTNFFKTGKLDFKQFADDILTGLDKLAVQQLITAPLANSLGFGQGGEGGIFGNGGFLSSLFGGGGLGGVGQLGTPQNPMVVKFADGAAGLLGAGAPGGDTGIFGTIFDGISSLFGGSGGAGAAGLTQTGAPVDLASLASSLISTIGFATGGSFMVGGQGGTDSQLVAFRASPNERVSVETPGQQRNSSNANSAPPQQTFNLHLHGVQDADSFRRSRGQIAAGFGGMAARARSRNGG